MNPAEKDCSQTGIVRALLASYGEVGGINNIEGHNLPSKRAIPAICQELLKLLFPGFLDDGPLNARDVESLTSERIASVGEKLCLEISRSLQCKDAPGPDCEKTAAAICGRFLRQLPDVRAILRTDVEAAFDGDPAARSFEEIILAYPCIEAIAIQRLAHILYAEDVPILPRMLTEWAHDQTGIDIHPGATIGSHFFIDHGTGVVIGETCEIGDHVKLYQGVTLGARSFPKDEHGRVVKGTKRHPTVHDGVTIYANAAVLGGETTIGENSTIGGNVFLMHGVPANTVVTLEDGRYRTVTRQPDGPKPATQSPPIPA
ncbi:serine acetyltransferase [soil metagenome]